MFRIVCSDINLFKSAFGAIANIVNEVEMEIDSDGIRLNAIDGSHVTFVHLNIDEPSFDLYECDKPHKIRFDTDEFLKFIKRANKDSILELSIDSNNLVIRFEGLTNKTFKLRLMDVESDVPPMPDIEYPVRLALETKLFKEIVTDIDNFSQKLEIHNDNEKVLFTAMGDFCDAEIEWEHGQNIRESCKSIYDLSKIKEMLKADKFSNNCYLLYGSDMPLRVDLQSPDENEILSFLLAPRIEEED